MQVGSVYVIQRTLRTRASLGIKRKLPWFRFSHKRSKKFSVPSIDGDAKTISTTVPQFAIQVLRPPIYELRAVGKSADKH